MDPKRALDSSTSAPTESYLRDLLRVVPHWPRDLYLELAPRYWLATRARLDAAQLEREWGSLELPSAAIQRKTFFVQRVP